MIRNIRICNRLLHLVRKPQSTFLVGFIPILPSINAKDVNESEQSIQSEHKSSDSLEDDGGWQRLKAVYETDEYGCYSKELNASLQGTAMAALFGAILGGYNRSKEALADFMERNHATAYEDHLDAKKRLQNHVTIHFAKGAWSLSTKLAIFTGGFMLFLTSASAYRGESRLTDYVLSGAVVGALFRLKLGPRAFLAGGLTGGLLGLISGLMTQGLFSLTDNNLDDVLAFQYELQKKRKQLFIEGESKENEKELLSKEIEETMKSHENVKDKKL